MAAERKIGPDLFRVQKMGARASQRMLLRIGRMVGPALDKFVAALSTGENAETGALAAIAGLLANANEDEADKLLVDLCEQGTINVGAKAGGQYEPIIFEHHLDDDLRVSWQVAAFVLEVNFSDFFADAVGGMGQVRLRAAQAATSRPAK